jgi:hypothetical protein
MRLSIEQRQEDRTDPSKKWKPQAKKEHSQYHEASGLEQMLKQSLKQSMMD